MNFFSSRRRGDEVMAGLERVHVGFLPHTQLRSVNNPAFNEAVQIAIGRSRATPTGKHITALCDHIEHLEAQNNVLLDEVASLRARDLRLQKQAADMFQHMTATLRAANKNHKPDEGNVNKGRGDSDGPIPDSDAPRRYPENVLKAPDLVGIRARGQHDRRWLAALAVAFLTFAVIFIIIFVDVWGGR